MAFNNERNPYFVHFNVHCNNFLFMLCFLQGYNYILIKYVCENVNWYSLLVIWCIIWRNTFNRKLLNLLYYRGGSSHFKKGGPTKCPHSNAFQPPEHPPPPSPDLHMYYVPTVEFLKNMWFVHRILWYNDFRNPSSSDRASKHSNI